MSEGHHHPHQNPRELLQAMPFAASLGVVLEVGEAAEVPGRLVSSPERCTAGGVLHGGVLMALADSLGGICAFLNLSTAARTTRLS